MRIKTKIGNDVVYTLYSISQWVTIIRINGKSTSITAQSFVDAGHNHLQSCLKVRNLQGERRIEVQSGWNETDVPSGESQSSKD